MAKKSGLAFDSGLELIYFVIKARSSGPGFQGQVFRVRSSGPGLQGQEARALGPGFRGQNPNARATGPKDPGLERDGKNRPAGLPPKNEQIKIIGEKRNYWIVKELRVYCWQRKCSLFLISEFPFA